MSILKKLPESGCLIYGFFLLWIGIIWGIPTLIWDESAVNGSGIAGMCAAMVIPVFLNEGKNHFVRGYPLTTGHLCYVFSYAIAMSIYIIRGEDEELFVSILFGIGALLISFIIDLIHYEQETHEQ